MSRRGSLPSQTLASLRDQIADHIAQREVEVVRQLVHACFRDQRNPDGSRWPERADGSGRPLLLTLEDAVEVYHDGETIYVDVPGKEYANYQFYGTRTIPSRMWAPAPGEPLPPEWRDAVDASVREFIATAWRNAR